jgi:hypothetical protein
VSAVVFYNDADLRQRWANCSKIKLWRLRKAGVLNSIQLGGSGPYLTSHEEVLRIEALPSRKIEPRGITKLLAEGKGRPPDKAKPGPRVDAQGTGSMNAQGGHPQSNFSHRANRSSRQAASSNGGAS